MNKRGDLISREAVKKLLGDLHIKYYGDVILAVMDLPAVDAVEVVRCSKCKYGGIDDPDFPNQYLCHYDGYSWNRGEHFCGYGKPRMDGE